MNEETTFDFSYVLATLWKRIILIIFIVILGFASAILYNYTAPLKYQSKATLYVQPKTLITGQVSYDDILSSQRLVKTYSEIIKSRSIVTKAKENLNLSESYEQLTGYLDVNSVKDTEIISIIATTSDPILSQQLANELSKVFLENIKESLEVDNVHIIDEATTNQKPVSPNVVINCALGGIAGLVIGIFFAFLVESMDNNIKNHDDIKKHLKQKVLGMIPHNSIDYENSDKKNKKKDKGPTLDLKIVDEPNSLISESYRVLRTNLNFMDLKLVNITSTLSGEGKTNVVSNLAISFAMIGKRVLVVDCDLRKPKIHKCFNIYRGEGVSDIVLSKGEKDFREIVQHFKTNQENLVLDILPAGSKISNPSELINNHYFQELLNSLKEDYDLVLIDCPPISMMTDGVLVSKLCDGTVYVVESDRTDYHVVKNSMEQLQNAQAFLLGVVLTKVNVKSQKKLYGYQYEYYYSDHH